MKPTFRLALLAAALATGTACSGSGSSGNYIDGTRFPQGPISLSNPETGAAITTSAQTPYDVSGNAFSIGITEKDFGGPYVVSSYSFSTGFNEPCYEPHQIDADDATNIIQFRPDNAAPIGSDQPNPCNPDTNDLEVWLINDGKGHTLLFYTYLPANPVTTTTTARTRGV